MLRSGRDRFRIYQQQKESKLLTVFLKEDYNKSGGLTAVTCRQFKHNKPESALKLT